MSDFGTEQGFWLARAAGACAGSAISLIYLLPKGRREAASRFFTGLACGLTFGGPAGVLIADRLGITAGLSGTEIMLSGSAAASLTAWWALGILHRLVARYGARP